MRVTVDELKTIFSKYTELQEKLKQAANDITAVTELTEKLKKVTEELDALIELLEINNTELFENALFYNKLVKYKSSKMPVNKKLQQIKSKLEELGANYDFEGKIKSYVRVVDKENSNSEEEIDFEDIADEIIQDLDVKYSYRYYGSSKSGIVYLEPLSNDYSELFQIDYDVLINEVFRKYPTVTIIKLNLKEDFPTLTLNEIMSNATKFLNKPVRVRATLLSKKMTPISVYFKYEARISSEEQEIFYNLPPQLKLAEKARINSNSEENILQNFLEVELADTDTVLSALVPNHLINKIKDRLGSELEFWGILYTLNDNSKSLKRDYIMLITEIRETEEQRTRLTKEREEEIREFLKQFRNGSELLDWMIENYAPHIKADKNRKDFIYRMKLTHLILAQNTYINNKEMIHSLLLSKKGTGKTTLAQQYLPLIARAVKYTDSSRISVPGLLGGLDVQTKEVRTGLLKNADKGVLVIDEVDKLEQAEKKVITALNTVMSSGKVSITLGNSSRHLEYETRPNLLLLGNYSEEELKKQLSYYSGDESSVVEIIKEFISKELLKVTNHISTLDRLGIVDSDLFDRDFDKEETVEDISEKILSVLDRKEQTIDSEDSITAKELVTLRLIRDILIYNSYTVNREKILKSLKRKEIINEIARFVQKENREDSYRFINYLTHIITIISTLRREDEVSRETLDTAFLLVSQTTKILRLMKETENELKEMVKEFFEEKVFKEMPIDGFEIDSLEKKFRTNIVALTDAEQRKLKEIFREYLDELIAAGELRKEGTRVNLGAKRAERIAETIRDNYFIHSIERDQYSYFILPVLQDKFNLSQVWLKKILEAIYGETMETKVTDEGKRISAVAVETQKVKEVFNNSKKQLVGIKLYI